MNVFPPVVVVAAIFTIGLCSACDLALFEERPPLFAVDLSVEGEPVGSAVVDTGGGYEIMLRESFGLALVDTVEVVVFGGNELVDVTEGFSYTVGGVEEVARGAIVSASICNCNAVGFHFFRKTGLVLSLDFAYPTVTFVPEIPRQGIAVDFHPPPAHLSDFDSAFIEVDVSAGGSSQTVLALLDTGANATVIRRGLVELPIAAAIAGLREVTAVIAHDQLGSVEVDVALFDNTQLPDMILGTDAMRAWGNRWFFSFAPIGGTITVVADDAEFGTSGR